MTLSQIRAMWRRKVNDAASVVWTDADALIFINLAYAYVQKEIVKTCGPAAHQLWDYMNSTAGTNWYPLPETFGVRRIGLKAAATDTSYAKLKRKDYDDILSLPTASADTFYALEGQWIGIFPAPPASVTNGIEVIHSGIASLSADTDVPRIKTPLHEALALKAKLIALGETDETSGETTARLQEILGDLPSWYNMAASDGPEKFVLPNPRIGMRDFGMDSK